MRFLIMIFRMLLLANPINYLNQQGKIRELNSIAGETHSISVGLPIFPVETIYPLISIICDGKLVISPSLEISTKIGREMQIKGIVSIDQDIRVDESATEDWTNHFLFISCEQTHTNNRYHIAKNRRIAPGDSPGMSSQSTIYWRIMNN